MSPLNLIDDVVEFTKTPSNEEELDEIAEESITPEAVDLSEDDLGASELESIAVQEETREAEEKIEEPEIADSEELAPEFAPAEFEPAEEAEPEVQISQEEILSTIDEKSENIISQAIEDVSVANSDLNMFSDEENETAEDTTEEGNIDEIYVQEEASTVEETPYEEIPLTESFGTEVHASEEILDYTPDTDAENEVLDEISLAQELEESEPVIIENAPEELPEIEEVELPAGVDLDLNTDIAEEVVPEILEDEPVEEEISEFDEASLQVDSITENEDADFDEIVELDPLETDENDIIIDMEEEPAELPDDIDEQIVKDVDKVFTTRKDDEISDTDLDFIDELNSDDGEILEEISDSDDTLEELAEADDNGILEEVSDENSAPLEQEVPEESEILQTKNSSTPIVPIYDADIPQEDMVESDPIQQGDLVMHTKYGTGVVEKMIKYGNKTLFSINFDNIGRRLLDPTLTEIKKA